MKLRIGRRSIGILSVSLLLATSAVLAQGYDPAGDDLSLDAEGDGASSLDWGFTLYAARLSEDRLDDTLLFQADFEDSQVWVAAISRDKWRPNRHIVLGLEGQLAKHTGPVQHHWEINGLGTLRWLTFPWNRYIDTSAAVGLGLSYATELPEFEVQDNGSSNQWLAYMLVELTARLPSVPQWQLVVRVHHRSAAFGVFEENVKGGSNGAGIGIKYRW
jgi:hypothetical protein